MYVMFRLACNRFNFFFIKKLFSRQYVHISSVLTDYIIKIILTSK